ncbi:MAG: hypothetical protein WC510_06465 [Candidatus Omnitrophota bacterium]
MRKSPACLFLTLTPCLLAFFLCGCQPIKPTYTKEDITASVISLCKKEYQVEPKVWLRGETVWIYLSLPNLITKELQVEKTTAEKINKVIMGASRVILSMNPRPQFIAIVASDTQEYGIDYTIINWIPDIVKYQLQFISRDEFFHRTLIKTKQNFYALYDDEGEHIEKTDIALKDFLAEQIMQRTQLMFLLEPEYKGDFKVKKIQAGWKETTLSINADITQVKGSLPKQFNIRREIAKIAAYTFKAYDFKDFLAVEITNTDGEKESVFTRIDLKRLL